MYACVCGMHVGCSSDDSERSYSDSGVAKRKIDLRFTNQWHARLTGAIHRQIRLRNRSPSVDL